MRTLALLAAGTSLELALRRINRAIIRRVTAPGPGISPSWMPQPIDFERARKDESTEEVSNADFKRIGGALTSFGLLTKAPQLSSETTSSTLGTNHKEDSSEEGGEESAGEESAGEESAGEESAGEEGTPSIRGQTTWKARTVSKHATQCKCDKSVPLTTCRRLTDKKNMPLPVAMQFLGQVIKKLDEGDTSAGDWRVCFYHVHRLASHLGLVIKKLKKEQLVARLHVIWDNRTRLGQLKTQHDTYHWFRLMNRPPRPADSLGLYKFFPASLQVFTYNQHAVFKHAEGDDEQ